MWAPDSTHLLFDSNGRLWLYDLRNGTGVADRLLRDAAPATIPSFRPTASHLLHARPQAGRDPAAASPARRRRCVALPRPTRPTLNGEVDWVYEEELDVRSNYFWSPDSKTSGLSADERDAGAAVSDHRLDSDARTGGSAALSAARRPEPDVRVGVVSAQAARRTGSSCPSRPGRITFRASAGSIARRCGSRPSPAITSTAIFICRRRQRGVAPGAGDRPTTSSSTRTTTSAWATACIVLTQLERRPQSSLSLQLRPAKLLAAHCQAGAATDQRRFRSERRLQRRFRATRCVDYASNEGNRWSSRYGR